MGDCVCVSEMSKAFLFPMFDISLRCCGATDAREKHETKKEERGGRRGIPATWGGRKIERYRER